MIDEKPKQPQKSTQNWFSKFSEDYARKQELIEKPIQFEKDENIYSNLSYDELFQMLKERKIKYYGKSIAKQELIELLTEFDKDLPIFDYPKMNCKQLKQICRERKIVYPDNVKKQDIIQLIIKNHEDILKIKQQIQKNNF